MSAIKKYALVKGEVLLGHITCTPEQLQDNLDQWKILHGNDLKAVDGDTDARPTCPGPDYEWDESQHVWRPTVKSISKVSLLLQIELLERQQARPHRELALNPQNKMALERLESIDQQIGELRGNLSELNV